MNGSVSGSPSGIATDRRCPSAVTSTRYTRRPDVAPKVSALGTRNASETASSPVARTASHSRSRSAGLSRRACPGWTRTVAPSPSAVRRLASGPTVYRAARCPGLDTGPSDVSTVTATEKSPGRSTGRPPWDLSPAAHPESTTAATSTSIRLSVRIGSVYGPGASRSPLPGPGPILPAP